MRIFPKVEIQWRDTRMVYWYKGMKITRLRPNKGLGSYNATTKTATLIIVPGEFSSVKIVSLFHELLHHWQHAFRLPSLMDRFLDSKRGYRLLGNLYHVLSLFEFRLVDRPARKLRRVLE